MGRAPKVIAVTAAAAAVAVGGGWAVGYGPLARAARPGPAASGAVPVSTATVVRATITATEQNAGTIAYDGSFAVYSQLSGTITWLPAPGQVIRAGRRLLAVDGQDVLLLAGRQPAWRAFGPGMSDGPDVRELERNLAALGCDPYHAMTIDDHYDWATQAAIERWQAARGVPAAQQDGQISLGQVVFLPQPIRVAALNAQAGAPASPGTPVLTATSATPVVEVALPTSEESLVRPGQQVTITLPGGATAPGRVLQTGQAVTGGQASGQSTGGSQGSGTGQSQSSSPPTVTLTVGLAHPSAAAGLDQAPVQVAIATATQRDALVAPVSALLARPGGGYQVVVVRGGTHRYVTVHTGLFDDPDGTVAISGPGITDGTRVEVPAS